MLSHNLIYDVINTRLGQGGQVTNGQMSTYLYWGRVMHNVWSELHVELNCDGDHHFQIKIRSGVM